MPSLKLLPLEEMVSRLERVLAVSPADATEIAWIELARGAETNEKRRRESFERGERTILVRVRERGRIGCHRTGAGEMNEIENAVREALAQARISPQETPAPPSPPPDNGHAPREGHRADEAQRPRPLDPAALYDEEAARLDGAAAQALLKRLGERQDRQEREAALRLGWVRGHVAVVASRSPVRAARATAVSLDVARPHRPGAGRAAGAARSLAGLAPREIVERARLREGPAELAEAPSGAAPLLLSPESAAALVALLNRLALSSTAFRDRTSLLCDDAHRLGNQIFQRSISLRDDGTDTRGLPFPFDLSGALKLPVDLIAEGVALGPALDQRLALELGRSPTPHVISPGEAIASNLFLLPGAGGDGDLAHLLGEGALWVGALDALECSDPRTLRFRAIARGVREIAGGLPGRSVPDLVWEDRLGAVLARAVGVGNRPLVIAGDEPLLGGISAPSLAIGRAEGLRPAGRESA